MEENGVGKFEDFSDEALEAIKDLGVSHIWYTGVLHHAMVTDYSDFGTARAMIPMWSRDVPVHPIR